MRCVNKSLLLKKGECVPFPALSFVLHPSSIVHPPTWALRPGPLSLPVNGNHVQDQAWTPPKSLPRNGNHAPKITQEITHGKSLFACQISRAKIETAACPMGYKMSPVTLELTQTLLQIPIFNLTPCRLNTCSVAEA